MNTTTGYRAAIVLTAITGGKFLLFANYDWLKRSTVYFESNDVDRVQVYLDENFALKCARRARDEFAARRGIKPDTIEFLTQPVQLESTDA